MNEEINKTIKSRLNRASGQIQGVSRMVEERRYCIDVIRQIRAAKSALSALEGIILERHLQTCVTQALTSKDKAQSNEKIAEILGLFREAQK